MRILFLNRSFAPDVEATGQLLGELCADLAQAHAINVIAGKANFLSDSWGFSLVRTEQQGSVRVYRVNNFRFNKQSALGRACGLLTYFFGAALIGMVVRHPDVIVVETDPPFLGMLGALLKACHRARLVYYLQDLFPEVGLAMGRLRPGLLTCLLRWSTQVGLRAADRIVVIGEDMRRKVIARGIAPEAIAIIPNWTDTNLVRPEPDRSALRHGMGLDDRFTVAYSGNLGLSQSLEAILDAADELRREPIQFVLIGEGASKQELMRKAQRLELTNVRFLPYQPKERLSAALGMADVHIIPMKRGLAGCVVPSKLYGILAAGRPYVAAVDDDCDVATVTRTHGTGLVIAPDDVACLVGAIRHCRQHPDELDGMGRRGRALAESAFDRHVSVQRFDRVLCEVCCEPTDSRSYAAGQREPLRIEPRTIGPLEGVP